MTRSSLAVDRIMPGVVQELLAESAVNMHRHGLYIPVGGMGVYIYMLIYAYTVMLDIVSAHAVIPSSWSRWWTGSAHLP